MKIDVVGYSTPVCCGRSMEPATDRAGSQGDACRACGRFTLLDRSRVVQIVVSHCQVCGLATGKPKRIYCHRHDTARKRHAYNIRETLGLPHQRGGTGKSLASLAKAAGL